MDSLCTDLGLDELGRSTSPAMLSVVTERVTVLCSEAYSPRHRARLALRRRASVAARTLRRVP